MSTDLAEIEAALKAATLVDYPLYEVRSDGSIWSAWNWRGYGRRRLTPTTGNNAASNLRYGTAQDNADDRSAHGHTIRGAQSPNARLTPSEVSAIREMSGMGDGPLAYAFGVSKRTVRRVIRRESYTNVA